MAITSKEEMQKYLKIGTQNRATGKILFYHSLNFNEFRI